MRLDDNLLELIISDNGQGFEPGDIQTDNRSHFGLGTMRERAETIGATFDIESKPGIGTQVKISLPFEES